MKSWGKSVKGFLSYDRTNKETDIQPPGQRFVFLITMIPFLTFVWSETNEISLFFRQKNYYFQLQINAAETLKDINRIPHFVREKNDDIFFNIT